MRVRFWGVRGSTPTPQKENMGYGGNTSCIELRTNGGHLLIFDGGTGIRLLGKELVREFDGRPISAHILFSHFHLDHIQGVPFFKPLYDARNHFTFYIPIRPDSPPVNDALAVMMANPYFPVDISKLPSQRSYTEISEGTLKVADVSVLTLPLHHPQGCFGYRVTQDNKSIAYCTDFEHGVSWGDENLRRLAQNADILIIDSQYTPEELPEHVGWGHSSWKQSLEAGIEAGARQVVLFHHDPYHEDREIDAILKSAQNLHANVIAAWEGLELAI